MNESSVELEGRSRRLVPKFVISLISLATLIASAAVAEAPREARVRYIATNGSYNITSDFFCDGEVDEVQIGGACFRLDGTGGSATIEIEDSNGQPVDARFDFVVSQPSDRYELKRIEGSSFCSSTSISIPQWTYWLQIHVAGSATPVGEMGICCDLLGFKLPSWSGVCDPGHPLKTGTTGVLTAHFG